ncbi:MAG TPA: hypothetical protein VEI94_03000 [Candidatus Bathyarchaeia archaeon]|nr:hypothetical protein [Candidatus Bathyarchaeia archaeon]
MDTRKLYFETFCISLAVILLEVSYTRVFSYKLVYYFTYLIISISLLGLGSGGVVVAVVRRLRRASPASLIPRSCLIAAVAVLAGYFVVALLPLQLFKLIDVSSLQSVQSRLFEAVKLGAICLTLFVPFFTAGIALATIFATGTERIHRLYFADLLGAGLGCAACVPLIATISPPGSVLLAGFFFALAAVRLARGGSRWLGLALAPVALLLLLGAAFPRWLPDPVPDAVKVRPINFAFSRWSPVFRVDVLRIPDPNILFLSHDGTLSSSMTRFDGNPTSLAHYDKDDRSYPFQLLGPSPRVAIIGSAGGNEILASLHFDARHITAIELNPVTVSLLRDRFADFTGHLAEDPRVSLVNAEGRSFLAGDPSRYDLVWFVAPDTYAAMNAATSGAFVLSESYLYTVEMIDESLAHLEADGLVCAQFGEVDFEHKPNRTLRYLATAREALHRIGIDDFERHVLVATTPSFAPAVSANIMLRKAPFTAEEVRRFVEHTARLTGGKVRYAWGGAASDGPIGHVISLDGPALEHWYESYPFDVRPATDDSPFFWHFVRFRDVIAGTLRSDMPNLEEGLGERLLLVLLGVAVVFATLLLLVPLLAARGIWSAIPYKANAVVYFAALGLGFMFLEVSLIQRLTLFLGYPTYSLTVTLFSLLLSTGLGSLASERLGRSRRAMLIGLGAGLSALVLFYSRMMTPIVAHGIGWPLGLRIVAAVVMLAPLGLCLGAFMPLGLRVVSSLTPYGQEFVAWSWAVNGFFSVVSSVLATVLSMSIGFDRVMLLAIAIYLVGIVALMRIPEGAARAAFGRLR